MIRLHGYWRSSASYRVRIALALKGLAYEQVAHNLLAGEQQAADYEALNPQKMVPAMEVDGQVIIQSPAILEWLEEAYPAPALLPSSPNDRAIVRAMAAIVACDIHPLNNLRVVSALREDLGADKDAVLTWAQGWIGEGFAALEVLVQSHGDGFAFGPTPTLADCYLVPQIYSAARFKVDLSPYPGLTEAARNCAALPAFASAHPDQQPDAVR
ncbi:MAG: maleylacetoacetate isomerase [Sphingobium sp.]